MCELMELLSTSEPANSWNKMAGMFLFVSVKVEHDTLNIRTSPTEDLEGVKLSPDILHKHAFRIISFVKVFGRYLIFSVRLLFQLLANLISERVKSVNTQFKRQQLLIYLSFFVQKGGRQERLT